MESVILIRMVESVVRFFKVNREKVSPVRCISDFQGLSDPVSFLMRVQ